MAALAAVTRSPGSRGGEVVENKRLSETMELIRERQRERTEATIAKPSTTLRNLSAAGRNATADHDGFFCRGRTVTD